MNHHYLVCTQNKASEPCEFGKKIPYENDLESYCPKCGSDLIFVCPECGKALQNVDNRFCSWCGKSLSKLKDSC